MEQLYYTHEGTAYRLVSASRLIRNKFLIAGVSLNPNLSFNFPASQIDLTSIDTIYITNDKPIIPLLMFYNVQSLVVGAPITNCIMPYFGVINNGTGLPVTNVSFLKSLIKNMGNIETIFKEIPEPIIPAKPLFDKYGIKYNQCVYSEKDFIHLENKTIVPFRTLATDITVGVVSSQGSLVSGNYAISQSAIYFELLK